MATKRIKDLTTITAAPSLYVPMDSTGTGTGKATAQNIVDGALSVSRSAVITTTDATATAALTLTPTDNAVTRYRVSAVCGKASLNEYGGYEAIVVVSKASGVVTVGTAFGHSTGVTAGIPASDISAVASGATVIFKVTGTAATTLKWSLWVEAAVVTP